MKITRSIALPAVFVALLTGCGDGDEAADDSITTTAAQTTATTTTTTTISGAGVTTSTTGVPTLEQPAIWPAPGVVFESPEDAAADFVSKVLRVPPQLGEFQQGDSRSGEIEVLPPAETAGSGPIRSVLLMRRLGPDNGWFVLAAVNDNTTITSPESTAEVSAGPVEVSGEGRGFEGLLIVEAYVAGDAGNRLDQQTTQGGSFAEPEPYSVTVDLSGAGSGRTVLLLVRGGVGLDTDPGEFSAIPIIMD